MGLYNENAVVDQGTSQGVAFSELGGDSKHQAEPRIPSLLASSETLSVTHTDHVNTHQFSSANYQHPNLTGYAARSMSAHRPLQMRCQLPLTAREGRFLPMSIRPLNGDFQYIQDKQ